MLKDKRSEVRLLQCHPAYKHSYLAPTLPFLLPSMSQGWRLPHVMYDSWTDGMLLDQAIFSTATIINDQIIQSRISNHLSPRHVPGFAVRERRDRRNDAPCGPRMQFRTGLRLLILHFSSSDCFGLFFRTFDGVHKVLHVLHRGQSACVMTVRLAVSHSPEWSGDDQTDLGPSSPTGCEAGFHGSAFDLASAKCGGIKAHFYF